MIFEISKDRCSLNVARECVRKEIYHSLCTLISQKDTQVNNREMDSD